MTIDRAAPVRLALAFPNVYAVGMASLGYQLVYEMINTHPDASCERVFLPDPEDLAEHERSGERRGEHYSFTRQWVIWHLIEHDLHHGGEISLTLGAHELTAIDI